MFPESHKEGILRKGHIELICGSMFSGKTEELIRRLKRAKIAKQKVEIFKPRIDTRYDETNVVSHDSNSIHSTPVESSEQILLYANDVEVIGIDEAQFFDEGLPAVCQSLADRGVRIIIAGLDIDYLGKPFGCMPDLLAIAEYVTKVHAICMSCGDLAHYSHRIVEGSSRILLGEQGSYIPLCRACFNRERQKKNE
jgi:thymidine kinase